MATTFDDKCEAIVSTLVDGVTKQLDSLDHTDTKSSTT